VSQTFLSAIMFGWASLVPILRDEGVKYSPLQLSQIFTAAAVGNYLSSFPIGVVLDRFGPKFTGMVCSALYGLGLFLCATKDRHFLPFLIGFGLIGVSRPGVQMPAMHLARLFDDDGKKKNKGSGNNKSKEGGGGGAFYMAAQAAAFDAGTCIFAIFYWLHFQYGTTSETEFTWYLCLVPTYFFFVAWYAWPHTPLPKVETGDEEEDAMEAAAAVAGSPVLTPRRRKRVGKTAKPAPRAKNSQVDAPLSLVLTRPAFWSLATWLSCHIYKLNFVVATINDQLLHSFDDGSDDAAKLIDLFGAMLPFGFVALPLVAKTLHERPLMALQAANVIGFVYGAVFTFAPDNYNLLAYVAFPLIACSRQLVFSSLFHTIGQNFGFKHYGVLFGIANVTVSIFQSFQTPMVEWAENNGGDYFQSNFILWIVTVLLLFTVPYSDPTNVSKKDNNNRSNNGTGCCGWCCYSDSDNGDNNVTAIAADSNESTFLIEGHVDEEDGTAGNGGRYDSVEDSTAVSLTTSNSSDS